MTMDLNGFIKLHRKLVAWGWYQDYVVKDLFLHLLLTANFKATNWRGEVLEAGQLIVGTQRLANDLGFSRQQIRTALDKLKSTNEITIKTTNKYSVVTIVNWREYQSNEENSNQQNNQHFNQQITNNQPQRKNDKKNKEDHHLELIQSISHNFTDKILMRDRVVNKEYCETLT